jgi:hypothetical protein
MSSALPLLPAGSASQQAIDDAGIPAVLVHRRNGMFIQMLAGSTPDDTQVALGLASDSPAEIPYTTLLQIDLTNKWLTVKACFDALPAVPDEGSDPHEVARARLAAEVQVALDALTDAGGPG